MIWGFMEITISGFIWIINNRLILFNFLNYSVLVNPINLEFTIDVVYARWAEPVYR